MSIKFVTHRSDFTINHSCKIFYIVKSILLKTSFVVFVVLQYVSFPYEQKGTFSIKLKKNNHQDYF